MKCNVRGEVMQYAMLLSAHYIHSTRARRYFSNAFEVIGLAVLSTYVRNGSSSAGNAATLFR
jgi:hypothetical protein